MPLTQQAPLPKVTGYMSARKFPIPEARTSHIRIVLFTERNSPFGEQFLRRICQHQDSVTLAAVVTRPQGVFAPEYPCNAFDVTHSAASFEAPILAPAKIQSAAAELKSFGADYFVVANYQCIIPRSIYQLSKRCSLNFHVGPLPRYAGLKPWHWMWLNHEKQGGVAAIRINDVIDAGDILEELPVPILSPVV